MNAVAIISQEQIDTLIKDVQFIKQHIEQSRPGGALEDLITEDQLKEKLGNVHSSTIWRHEARGKLNPIKIGNSKMYRLSEVLELNTKSRRRKYNIG